MNRTTDNNLIAEESGLLVRECMLCPCITKHYVHLYRNPQKSLHSDNILRRDAASMFAARDSAFNSSHLQPRRASSSVPPSSEPTTPLTDLSRHTSAEWPADFSLSPTRPASPSSYDLSPGGPLFDALGSVPLDDAALTDSRGTCPLTSSIPLPSRSRIGLRRPATRAAARRRGRAGTDSFLCSSPHRFYGGL